MREPTYERKGHLLKLLATGEVRDCQSINSAKATSRELQKRGEVVRVVDHHPPKPRIYTSKTKQHKRKALPRSQAPARNDPRDVEAQIEALKRAHGDPS